MEIQRTTGVGLENTMYVGDSITDMQALQLVRDGGGVAVSFNGNAYAVREAEICVISPNTVLTSVLAETFSTAGREGVMNLADNWGLDFLRRSGYVHDHLIKELEGVFPDQLPTLERITFDNMERLTRESSSFRKTVRGEQIGSLG
jgi:energy-converting hydrogenase A subunit R